MVITLKKSRMLSVGVGNSSASSFSVFIWLPLSSTVNSTMSEIYVYVFVWLDATICVQSLSELNSLILPAGLLKLKGERVIKSNLSRSSDKSTKSGSIDV